MTPGALWTCPACRRGFANRNQSHACGVHDLEAHFARRPPEVRTLFDQLLAEVRRNGPVTVLIDFKWEPVALVGPLWAQFWGDGAYAGTQMMMSARKMRRYYGKDRQASSIGTHPGTALIAKLASARTWTAVAVDSTGVSVHETGPKEWQARIAKIPVLAA